MLSASVFQVARIESRPRLRLTRCASSAVFIPLPERGRFACIERQADGIPTGWNLVEVDPSGSEDQCYSVGGMRFMYSTGISVRRTLRHPCARWATIKVAGSHRAGFLIGDAPAPAEVPGTRPL